LPSTFSLRLALVATILSLWACGGTSRSSSSPASGPAVSDRQANAIGDAEGAIIGAANAEGYVVGHARNVRQAQRLLKPLTVANSLQVGPSNETAGGLVANLMGELDNLVPGLTVGDGSQEHLDAPIVHRFLVFGLKDPAQVFKPKAAAGVRQLDRLLRGIAAQTRVTLTGVQPPQTAGQAVDLSEQRVAPYWPDLLKRLQALNASLR
jgi:hypothetical protein